MSYVGRHRDPQQMLPGQFLRRYRTLFGVLFAVLIITSSIVGCSSPNLQNVTAPSQAKPWSLTPCVYEDGSGGPLPCLWDATKQGNGIGMSFWIDRHGRIHPLRTLTPTERERVYDVVVDAAFAAEETAHVMMEEARP